MHLLISGEEMFNSLHRGLIRFINFLFNKRDQPKRVIHLDSEAIERDRLISRLKEEVSTLKGQMDKAYALEKEKKDKERDKDIQQDLIKRLNEEDSKIRKKGRGATFSLNKFYGRFFSDSKFRNSIEITDKDDETVLGFFKEFVVLEDGKFGIVDQDNNVIWKSYSLRGLIYKPEGLGNYLRRKRIPLPVDKDMQFIPDIETMQVPEMIYDEDSDSFKEAQELLVPVKEYVKKRERIIQEKDQYIETMESLSDKQRRTINELKRTNIVLQNKAGAMESEFSKIMSKTIEFDRAVGDMHNKFSHMSVLNAMKEQMIAKLEAVNSNLLRKIEGHLDKTTLEQVEEQFKNNLEYVRSITPEQIKYLEEPQKEYPKPGEKVN